MLHVTHNKSNRLVVAQEPEDGPGWHRLRLTHAEALILADTLVDAVELAAEKKLENAEARKRPTGGPPPVILLGKA